MKILKFYVPGEKPIKLNKYTIKVIKTKRGLRKVAVGEYKGRKLYRFVKWKEKHYFSKVEERDWVI